MELEHQPHKRRETMLTPSMLWQPAFLDPAQPYWIGHIPFAFWVIEAARPRTLVELGTHSGNSYFAFCQAVARLQLNSKCYAVDTWQGDAHTGAYGEEIFSGVDAYNSEHFANFSTLIRSSFDEAAGLFSEGSIDLLHIDGCHTYEAVRQDFTTWLPKMSEKGVVLLHDTNVWREPFGVSRFFQHLQQEYPTFHFQHSNGLGVVGVGASLDATITHFLESTQGRNSKVETREIFSLLGQNILDRAERHNTEKQLVQERLQIEELRTKLAVATGRLSEMRTSTSWRVTSPLRWCGDLMRGVWALLTRLPMSIKIFNQHRTSGLFKKEWYLTNNHRVPSVLAFAHFCLIGAFRGRAPNCGFDESFYQERHLEAAASHLPPLLHYLLHGFSSGLRGGLFDQKAASSGTTEEGDRIIDRPITASEAESDIRCIAFYLPQFHAIPENDSWWGEGFTEWTNVRRGQPLYEGHYQPHVPHPDIGYYDLNDPAVLEKQADMARSAGIEGFCFYYYWFGGKRLLEMPTDRILKTGRPEFPFCFCWANENWTRRWDGGDHEVLISQTHNTDSDERFILDLLPAFRDRRYIRVEDKPLLLVYRPGRLPDPATTTAVWRRVCRQEGIGEICLAYVQSFDRCSPNTIGFDWAVQFPPAQVRTSNNQSPTTCFDPEFKGKIFSYRSAANWYVCNMLTSRLWPGVCPSWDNTARLMQSSHVWHGATPKDYQVWIAETARHLRKTLPLNQRLLFINAWNEWAEGCHLEPDAKHGYAWLRATRLGLTQETTGKNAPR